MLKKVLIFILYLNLFYNLEQFVLVVNQFDQDDKNCQLNEFKKNGSLLIFRVFDNLLHVYPGLSNLYRKGVSRDNLQNAFLRMSLADLKNPNFEIPEILSLPQDNRAKTITSYQLKSGLKSLPVIKEHEGTTITSLAKIDQKLSNPMKIKKPNEDQKKKQVDSLQSMSFSKIHTKESEITSSIDLNSSFKSIPPIQLTSKGFK